jgi:hypothetical protein
MRSPESSATLDPVLFQDMTYEPLLVRCCTGQRVPFILRVSDNEDRNTNSCKVAVQEKQM